MSRAEASAHKLALLGAAVGSGAPDEGCADGPAALRDGALLKRLQVAGIAAEWLTTFSAPRRADGAVPLPTIAALDAKLAEETARLAGNDRRFVALGGDHSAAIGIWSGLARARRPGKVGLIWIDAHMDAHTFDTTPSGNLHGMPIACLLGQGEPALTRLAGGAAALAPENLCLIGTRSWEDGEADLLHRLGVRTILMTEVDERGFAETLDEAIAIATRGAEGFGVSIDIDAFDPLQITGTGLHVVGGLDPREVLAALRDLRQARGFAGLEIAEYNPHLDRNQETATLIGELVVAAFGAG